MTYTNLRPKIFTEVENSSELTVAQLAALLSSFPSEDLLAALQQIGFSGFSLEQLEKLQLAIANERAERLSIPSREHPHIRTRIVRKGPGNAWLYVFIRNDALGQGRRPEKSCGRTPFDVEKTYRLSSGSAVKYLRVEYFVPPEATWEHLSQLQRAECNVEIEWLDQQLQVVNQEVLPFPECVASFENWEIQEISTVEELGIESSAVDRNIQDLCLIANLSTENWKYDEGILTVAGKTILIVIQSTVDIKIPPETLIGMIEGVCQQALTSNSRFHVEKARNILARIQTTDVGSIISFLTR